MTARIAVVDYQKGNLKSVERGLAAAGGTAFITSDAEAIARADAIVLPGVGAFADAASTMRELGQMDVIRARVAEGVPFLGICLGLHLMFEEGVEGAEEVDSNGEDEFSNYAQGLAILPGVVVRMPHLDQAGVPHKVPHVGWNTVDWSGELAELSGQGGHFGAQAQRERCPLFQGIPTNEYFYFTHSYIAPSGPFVVAEASHTVAFPSAVQYGDAAFGVQFHPEKSSDAGALLLQNFVNLVKGA